MNTTLYVLTETIRCIALIIQPVMPHSAEKMLDQLSIPQSERTFMSLNAQHRIKPGTTIDAPQGVFPRIVEAAA